ncbi:MAG: hypothetical protein C5B52_12900 [Bacteroidetes bacterium]|nr:MAG: hypothetical protein C5B52_12900 [Bacteroidota bacterium]
MKKCLAVAFVMLSLCFGKLYAQEEAPAEKSGGGFDKSKLFFGGTFGLSFGDYTLVNVSPQVGYHFNKYLAAGTGINFIYSSFKTRYVNGDEAYRENYGNVGVNVFGRVYPIQFLLLQIQPELNYNWGNIKYANGEPTTDLKGKFIPCVLAGIGGVLPAGRGAMIAMLQYDLAQDPRSPYGNKVFFTFGYNF